MKLGHSLKLYTKINSKLTKNLNVGLDSIKLLAENTGRTVFYVNYSNVFFGSVS